MSQSQATAAGAQPVIVIAGATPPLLLRLVYFAAVGWWLGMLATIFAWLCVLSVLLLPLGLWVINRLPTLITLRPQGQGFRIEDGVLVRGKAQRPFIARAVYLLAVGWWLSAVWLVLAYVFVLTLAGIPIAFWMYERAGAVTTLYRS